MITIHDMIDRFGETEMIERSDRIHYAQLNDVVLQTAIDDAMNEIESYLNATGLIYRENTGTLSYRGALPKSLKVKACDIARYYLYEDALTDVVEKRYKQAIDWLKLTAKNPAMLTGQIDGVNDGVVSGIAVMGNCAPKMWWD